jgi:hypothetical protein
VGYFDFCKFGSWIADKAQVSKEKEGLSGGLIPKLDSSFVLNVALGYEKGKLLDREGHWIYSYSV